MNFLPSIRQSSIGVHAVSDKDETDGDSPVNALHICWPSQMTQQRFSWPADETVPPDGSSKWSKSDSIRCQILGRGILT